MRHDGVKDVTVHVKKYVIQCGTEDHVSPTTSIKFSIGISDKPTRISVFFLQLMDPNANSKIVLIPKQHVPLCVRIISDIAAFMPDVYVCVS